MTKLKLKDWNSERNKRTRDYIQFIVSVYGKKGIQKKNIKEIGQKLFKDFPKDWHTIYRYLNTMQEYGIVRLSGRRWFPCEELDRTGFIKEMFADGDIMQIKYFTEYPSDWLHENIMPHKDGEMIIYGGSPIVREINPEAFQKAVDKMREGYYEMWESMRDAIIKHLDNLYEEVLKYSEHKLDNYISDIIITKIAKGDFPIDEIDTHDGTIKVKTENIFEYAEEIKKIIPNESKKKIVNALKNYRMNKQMAEKLAVFITTYLLPALLSIGIEGASKPVIKPVVVINPIRPLHSNLSSYAQEILMQEMHKILEEKKK